MEITIALIVVGAVLLLLILSALAEGYKARQTSKAAYEAVTGLHDVAKAAHELAELEMRTAVSMGGTFGPRSFAQESNATARQAKMRGYEVWRNSHIEPAMRKLQAAYKRYESATRRMISIFNTSAIRLVIRDLLAGRRTEETPTSKFKLPTPVDQPALGPGPDDRATS